MIEENFEANSDLFDRPVLTVDPGVHTGQLNRVDIDARWLRLVTGSNDKTVRVWDATTGRLVRTIRMPRGPGHIGMVYAVAISPDGALIAAGGCTSSKGGEVAESIFLFDSETGEFVHRIVGLPGMVFHLAFSPSGETLAATLSGNSGMHVFSKDGDWKEIARDSNYAGPSYWAAFASDGKLATTSWDGTVRLYNSDGALQRMNRVGGRPLGCAFTPHADRLAVTFLEEPKLLVMDSTSLDILRDYGENIMGFSTVVDWSTDGQMMLAGIFNRFDRALVGVLSDNDFGLLKADGNHPFVALFWSASGERLLATSDSWIARDRADGRLLWAKSAQDIDWAGQQDSLGISYDGTIVDFAYGPFGNNRARFDVSKLKLSLEPPNDLVTKPPVPGFIDGRPVPISQFEEPRCLVDHPDGDRSIFGADWTLRAIGEGQTILWQQTLANGAWAVNISGDGRIVLAASGDGTLRWFRMEDGVELLAFFPMIDRENWVTWTPEGIYDATSGAREVLRWHINHGLDAVGEAVPVSDIPGTCRPDVLPHVIPHLGTEGALATAELDKIRGAVRRATTREIPQHARLHILAIGVSKHGSAGNGSRDLQFAHKDARDVAGILLRTQKPPYADVLPIVLADQEATRAEVIDSLESIRRNMANGAGDDLAVVFFSGHGCMDDNRLFLIPYDVDSSRIRATSVSIGEIHAEIERMTDHGRVLLVVDACHSGAIANWQGTQSLNAQRLRNAFDLSNVAILTSSSGTEGSIEHSSWENGAFTRAFLESLEQADYDGDGLISVSDLSRYVIERVPQLVSTLLGGFRQQPEAAIRHHMPIFRRR